MTGGVGWQVLIAAESYLVAEFYAASAFSDRYRHWLPI